MVDRLYWVSLLGWYHLAVFTVLIPLLVLRSRRILKNSPQRMPDRLKHFKTTAFTLVLFGAFSLLTARDQRVDLFRVDASSFWKALPAALAMYAATVVFMRPRWRKAVEMRKPIVRLFMPSNATERAWWIAVAVLAGISEEITWRGMQPMLIAAVVGNAFVAIALAALTFGLVHALQGWKSAAIIVFFALGFQALVWLGGSLYLAMAVHVAYDVTAGIAYGRLGRELGYESAVAAT